MGVHQLYLNRVIHGLVYLLAGLGAVILYNSGQGIIGFVPLWVAVVVDAFLMPYYERRSSGSFWGV